MSLTTTIPADSGVLGTGVLGTFTLGVSVSPVTTNIATLVSSPNNAMPLVGTLTTFSPTATQVFQFQATFDGELYTITVPWNVYRQNWYVNIRDQSANLVVAIPLIGSPPPPQNGVDLIGGYFTSTMYYYPSPGVFAVAP